MEGRRPLKRLSLEEFKARKEPADFQAVLSKINGGRFMECHQLIFEATGVWIPELVPVFQKLDAMLIARGLPAELS